MLEARQLPVDLGKAIGAHWPFYAGCGVAFGFALYHYMLIRDRTRDGCFLAFRHNAWVGFAVFAGTVADYALR